MTEDSHDNSGIHIDLADETADIEVNVKLKVAQLDLIYDILSQHIQPKGYEMIEFAYKKKHPFYLKYVKATEVEKADLRALIHISTDYTPNQYWFNLFFAWVIFFTTFWFIGLMVEACIVLMRRNSEARIKKYKLEQEQAEKERQS